MIVGDDWQQSATIGDSRQPSVTVGDCRGGVELFDVNNNYYTIMQVHGSSTSHVGHHPSQTNYDFVSTLIFITSFATQ